MYMTVWKQKCNEKKCNDMMKGCSDSSDTYDRSDYNIHIWQKWHTIKEVTEMNFIELNNLQCNATGRRMEYRKYRK